jgi:hypothetical protein
MGKNPINKIVVDAHVEIEFSSLWRRNIGETLAKELEGRAQQFMEFLRDHRSQDINGAYVIREYAYKCSACGYIYDDDPGQPDCCEMAVRCWASDEILREYGYAIEANAQ